MRPYHRTSADAAASILAKGFRDGEYQRIESPDGEPTGGVELATPPFDDASLPPARTEVLLAIELPEKVAEPREWHVDRPSTGVEPAGLPRPREFFIPAEIVNRYGPAEIVPEDD